MDLLEFYKKYKSCEELRNCKQLSVDVWNRIEHIINLVVDKTTGFDVALESIRYEIRNILEAIDPNLPDHDFWMSVNGDLSQVSEIKANYECEAPSNESIRKFNEFQVKAFNSLIWQISECRNNHFSYDIQLYEPIIGTTLIRKGILAITMEVNGKSLIRKVNLSGDIYHLLMSKKPTCFADLEGTCKSYVFVQIMILIADALTDVPREVSETIMKLVQEGGPLNMDINSITNELVHPSEIIE